MNNEENVNQNDARAILDGSSGKHKICLLSIIGEVEGHENLSGNTKTTKYDQILPSWRSWKMTTAWKAFWYC